MDGPKGCRFVKDKESTLENFCTIAISRDTKCRIGKSHMKTGFSQLWFLKKKIWSKYTLGIVVSWYTLRNCNIWLFLWHLSPQSGPFYQFWSFLLILFSKTTQKKSKHYSGRAFLEVFGKCVGLGLSSSFRDLKNANNSVAVDSQLNVLAFFPKCA